MAENPNRQIVTAIRKAMAEKGIGPSELARRTGQDRRQVDKRLNEAEQRPMLRISEDLRRYTEVLDLDLTTLVAEALADPGEVDG